MDAVEATERFVVDSDEALAWTMRRIANARSRIEEQAETARKLIAGLEDEVRKVGEWLDRETREDVATIDRMEAFAIDFLRRLQFEDIEAGREPSVKSRSTPWGTVKSHQVPPDIRREDEGALSVWAAASGYIRERVEIDWARIKGLATVRGERLVLDDGEVVPGVRAVSRPRSFAVVIDE